MIVWTGTEYQTGMKKLKEGVGFLTKDAVQTGRDMKAGAEKVGQGIETGKEYAGEFWQLLLDIFV